MKKIERTDTSRLFKENLKACRTEIFGLTYSDVTTMCGIAEAVMCAYDSLEEYHVPALARAKVFADMYCTDLDTLSTVKITDDPARVDEMRRAFLSRVTGKRVVAMTDALPAIRKLCEKNQYAAIPDDRNVVINFRVNCEKAMKGTGAGYKDIQRATGISPSMLTRIKHGSEPSITTVRKICGAFGMPIKRFIADDPKFTDEEIVRMSGLVMVESRGGR